MPDPIVLSHFQGGPLLEAHAAGQLSALTSPDLGLSQLEVTLSPEGVCFPNASALPWDQVERISRAENQCFLVEDGRATSIQVFSQTTNWLRSLLPTSGAPTMLVAGFPMHRIKGTDPWRDTQLKIAAAGPIAGHVLDTATGLGYTAIAAARIATHVTTVEFDPASLEVA